MDNHSIYKYAYYCMYNHVKENKEKLAVAHDTRNAIQRPLFILNDDNTSLYQLVARGSMPSLLFEMEKMIMRLLKLYGVEYDATSAAGIAFTRSENNLKVGYAFSNSIFPTNNGGYVYSQLSVDKIKVVALVELQEDIETAKLIVMNEMYKTKGLVEYVTLKEMFDSMGLSEEYNIYKTYSEDFNEKVRKLLGYSTVTIPSEEALLQFKKIKEDMLLDHDFSECVKKLHAPAIERINKNFYGRKLYKSLVGNSLFADSFISSEWYYDTHMATSGIEQTAIIAGYLKSVEQLLYAIVKMSIGQGREIKKNWSYKSNDDHSKNTNNNFEKQDEVKRVEFTEDAVESGEADITMGSLKEYLTRYKDLWDANKYVQQMVQKQLARYIKYQRNDHLHKDNVYTKEEIDEVRDKTFQMYYLLLGACLIPEDKEDLLCFEEKKCEENREDILTSERFTGWLERILCGDNLLDEKIPLFFEVKKSGSGCCQLLINSVSRVLDGKIPEGIEYPYCCDVLSWKTQSSYEKDVYRIKEMIVDYLQEGKYAELLKQHEFVATGRYGDIVILNLMDKVSD